MIETIYIYVGCSLMHSTPEYKAFIEALKKRLASIPNVVVLEFLGLKGSLSDAASVYRTDIENCVMRADMMVAEVSNGSTGLGSEIGHTNARHRPIWMFAKNDATVTRLLLGLAEVEGPRATIDRYFEANDIESVERVFYLPLKCDI